MSATLRRGHTKLLAYVLLGLFIHVRLTAALREFSLARYGVTFANNSVINIDLVGEGYPGVTQTGSGALECHTDDTTCCRGRDNPPNWYGRGEWYYPNGTVVPPHGGRSGIYRTRDHMVIRLNHAGRSVTFNQAGVYTCVIPGAGGVSITRYITLDYGQCNDLPDIPNGEITYTPPATLPYGRRYTGTVATYSCLSGYQLKGSSLRACGADGTWNGTTTSCTQTGTPTVITTSSPFTTTEVTMSTETSLMPTTSEDHTIDTDPTDEHTLSTMITTTEGTSAVDCGPLNDPTNGQVNTPYETTVGSTAVYSCNHGYTLIGSATTSCASNGIWSSPVPVCRVTTSTQQMTTTVEINNTSLGGVVGGVIGALLLVVLLLVAIIVIIVIMLLHKKGQMASSRGRSSNTNQKEVELQETAVSGSTQDPTYETVGTPVPVEYEEIKFKEAHGNPAMMEQPHPPKGDYEYTQCAAYAPTQFTLPTQK